MSAAEFPARVRSGDLELAVYSWGDDDGRPTVVLVHGYPDNAGIWREVAESLAEDHFVIAYDVRGAGASDRPKAVADYQLSDLKADLAAVLQTCCADRKVHLVGHDWGAIQGWEPATDPRFARRLASFTAISGPSLDHAGWWLRQQLGQGRLTRFADQFRRSWYVSVFQIPGLGSALWSALGDGGWQRALRLFDGPMPSRNNPAQQVDGATGVRLYRANVLPRLMQPRQRRAVVPVQVLVPRRDAFMRPDLFDSLPQWVDSLWRHDIDTGHWTPLSHPQLLVRKIRQFVAHINGRAESPDLERARLRAARASGPQQGRLVLVTGAASGIGRETALAFAEAGADVIVCDVDKAGVERTAKLCRLLGVAAWARRTDVGREASLRQLAQWVAKHFGAVDVLVNNAGIGVAGSFFDTDEADWERVLRINLGGVVRGCRLFGEQMRSEGRHGSIVNIASMGAWTPSRFMSAYNTSKAAVRMLSDCLRAELADSRIQVLTVGPGMAITNITRTTTFVGADEAGQAQRRDAATRLYQRRNLKPAEIAQAILKAVAEGADEVPVGAESHLARLLSRVSPGLQRRMARLDLDAQVRRVGGLLGAERSGARVPSEAES